MTPMRKSTFWRVSEDILIRLLSGTLETKHSLGIARIYSDSLGFVK